MKTLFAGLCLVFTTLFSCQQKEGQFKSVSVDDFSTLIANPEVQLKCICYNFFLGADYADFTEKFKKRIRVFRVIRA